MFRTAESSTQPQGQAPGATTAQTAGAQCYLTDGFNLYRLAGQIATGMGIMAELEDCRSLEVGVIPIGELHARGMRRVIPARD